MNDRQLLELAAKAAGIPYIKPLPEYDGRSGLCIGTNPMRTQDWDPLRDDGDALRLAVALRLDIEWRNDGRVSAFKAVHVGASLPPSFESSRDDVGANTRRAIVRAAAAMAPQESPEATA